MRYVGVLSTKPKLYFHMIDVCLGNCKKTTENLNINGGFNLNKWKSLGNILLNYV